MKLPKFPNKFTYIEALKLNLYQINFDDNDIHVQSTKNQSSPKCCLDRPLILMDIFMEFVQDLVTNVGRSCLRTSLCDVRSYLAHYVARTRPRGRVR